MSENQANVKKEKQAENLMAIWLPAVGSFVVFNKSQKAADNIAQVQTIRKMQEDLGLDSKYVYDGKIFTSTDTGTTNVVNKDSKGDLLKAELIKAGYKVWGSMAGVINSTGQYQKGESHKLYINMTHENGNRYSIEWNVNNRSTGTLLSKLMSAEKGQPIRIEVKSEGVLAQPNGKTVSLRDVKIRDLTVEEELKNGKGEVVKNKDGNPIMINPEIRSTVLGEKRKEIEAENEMLKGKKAYTTVVNDSVNEYIKTDLLASFLEKYKSEKPAESQEDTASAGEPDPTNDHADDVAEEEAPRPSTPKV